MKNRFTSTKENPTHSHQKREERVEKVFLCKPAQGKTTSQTPLLYHVLYTVSLLLLVFSLLFLLSSLFFWQQEVKRFEEKEKEHWITFKIREPLVQQAFFTELTRWKADLENEKQKSQRQKQTNTTGEESVEKRHTEEVSSWSSNFLPEEIDLQWSILYPRNTKLIPQDKDYQYAKLSQAQALAWLQARQVPQTLIDLLPTFYSSAEATGVRPSILLAQACLETNFFQFTGKVPENFHNPAGLKVASAVEDESTEAHQVFSSWEEGILAQAQHLALYAGAEGYPLPEGEVKDPRHFPFLYGTARSIEELSGKWAPSSNYGKSLLRYIREMFQQGNF